jgi:protein SCO1/2
MTASPPLRPSPRWIKVAVLGGIVLFILSLFVFFSPLLGLVKHNFEFLPYFGPREVEYRDVGGVMVADTLYHRVPPFAFTDQSGSRLTSDDLEGKILIVDFFFTRCTTICPRMKTQLQRLQFQLGDPAFDDVVFLSHTVDPEHDTPEVLRYHARKLKADTTRWKFLTGTKEELYGLGADGYFLAAREDVLAEDGFLHSEMFVLVDRDRHIRGYYDGTSTEEVNRLVGELKMLMKEEKIRAAEAKKAAPGS